MFTALMGVWLLIGACYPLSKEADRNVDVTLEELIAWPALLIQLHRELAGPALFAFYAFWNASRSFII